MAPNADGATTCMTSNPAELITLITLISLKKPCYQLASERKCFEGDRCGFSTLTTTCSALKILEGRKKEVEMPQVRRDGAREGAVQDKQFGNAKEHRQRKDADDKDNACQEIRVIRRHPSTHVWFSWYVVPPNGHVSVQFLVRLLVVLGVTFLLILYAKMLSRPLIFNIRSYGD